MVSRRRGLEESGNWISFFGGKLCNMAVKRIIIAAGYVNICVCVCECGLACGCVVRFIVEVFLREFVRKLVRCFA